MSGIKFFGDHTSWGKEPNPNADGGWYGPGSTHFIRPSDPCWGRVLDEARKTYGDPNIHYDTDDPGFDRHLVFGDGTQLPSNGMVIYHDAASKQNWAQRDDGTVSPVSPDGTVMAPVAPAGYRKIGDQYAPVNDSGQQVGPQAVGIPSSDNGFHTDPRTGLLTPKNPAGDYYTVGPDGQRHYFDRAGAPITADQFNKTQSAGGTAPPGPSPLSTDEQQSGKAADAVKKLHEEQQRNFSKLSDAEEGLSEVMLSAHAATADGQRRLNAVQEKLVEAVNNPEMSIDTAAGAQAYLKFLRGQVQEINDVVASGALVSEDASKAAAALSKLYAAEQDSSGSPQQSDTGQSPATPDPAPAVTTPAPVDPGLTDPGLTDPALSAPLPDPSLSDVLPGGVGALGNDPLSSLASSLLPGALSSLGGLGGGGLGSGDPFGLSGLAGAAAPLTGLASQLGDAAQRPDPADDHSTANPDAKTGKDSNSADASTDSGKDSHAGDAKADSTPAAAAPQASSPSPPAAPQPSGTAGDGAPPAAPAPTPVAPTSTVTLPDGSTADAKSPAVAAAVKSYQSGTAIDAAYAQNGIHLPPPGTPVTNPADPSQISCGYLGMFKDHYVVAASSVKAFQDGQIVPLSSVSSSPDFLGWIDPSTLAAAPAAPVLSVPASPPAPVAAS